jgi:hypothetical protein
MSLDIPSRALQQTSPAASLRASYETMHPRPTTLSPVAQSIEHKNSQILPTEDYTQRDLPDPPQDEYQPERPSSNLNRGKHSLRSRRSFVHDDRDDAKDYRAVRVHDYGAPPDRSSHARDFSNPRYEHYSSAAREFPNPPRERRSSKARDLMPHHDPRAFHYDHPYYNYQYAPPYYGPSPPHPHEAAPRVRARSNAAVGVSPPRTSRAIQPTKGHHDELSDYESEDEPPKARPRASKQRRALKWGYDENSRTPPPPQEVIMRLPYTEWMNSGLKERTYDWPLSRQPFILTFVRLRSHPGRICGNGHVPVLRFRWNPGRKHQWREPHGGSGLHHPQLRGLLAHCAHVHCAFVRFQSHGQCLDLLPHLGRPLQPCCYSCYGHGQIFGLHPWVPFGLRTDSGIDRHLIDREGFVPSRIQRPHDAFAGHKSRARSRHRSSSYC